MYVNAIVFEMMIDFLIDFPFAFLLYTKNCASQSTCSIHIMQLFDICFHHRIFNTGRELNHRFEMKKAIKRYFKCSNCKQRTTSLNQFLPAEFCKCSNGSWVPCSKFGGVKDPISSMPQVQALGEKQPYVVGQW